MKLIRGLSNPGARTPACALAIGNFDGLHHGHMALLAQAQRHARELAVSSAVMIFEPMPREFFARTQPPPRIVEFRDKLRRFERAGIDEVICLHFNKKLSSMSAEHFIDDLLLQRAGVKAVVIGDDFRFGAGRRGDAAMLRQQLAPHSVPVEVVSQVESDGERCSSTAIREALGAGDLSRAQRLLGRAYSMIGRVRHGLKLGRQLGMPTLNFPLEHVPALRLGVYAVVATELATGNCHNGVAAVGVRPTIGGTRPLLEVHLFDVSGDWYGRELEIEFRHFMRGEQHFDSLEALAAQMQRDGEEAHRLLM
jgi:riboflavin kinase/FMN adenylyltransferase